MSLPDRFQFSQASLQDFVDCRRRFQLRTIKRRAWPAVESEPALENERYLEMGALFHRMVQQYLLGVPPERLSGMRHNEQLRRWWDNFLEYQPEPIASQENSRHLEISLSAGISDHNRLVAKYDAIVISSVPEDRGVIFDWKTSRKRPGRDWLANRLQTRLYPYLLVRAGAHLHQGTAFQPQQVEMVYWYPEYPDHPERFPYNPGAYAADEEFLVGLAKQIGSLREDEYPLTSNDRHCRFCVYRSLCDRGVEAGIRSQDEDEYDVASEADIEDLDFDFEQIAEIEF